MEEKYILDILFESRTRVKILRHLSTGDGTVKHTGRQIARLVNSSVSATSVILNKLHRYHILDKEIAGKANLFSYNKKNHIVQEILIPLFKKERETDTAMENFITSQL